MRLFTIILLLASVLMVANLVQAKPTGNNQLSVYVFLHYEYYSVLYSYLFIAFENDFQIKPVDG